MPTVHVPPASVKSEAFAPPIVIEVIVARVPAGPSTAATMIVRAALAVAAA